MVALALAAPPSAAALAVDGVEIRIVSTGLVAPRVDLVAPRHLRPVVQEVIAWRVAAMRAQLVAQRLGAPARTLVAIPGVSTPLAPAVTWRGPVESYGRTTWQTRTAQRPLGGWCPSCGEAHANRHETGDCALCNAARIATLRAEGILAAATPAPVQPEAEPFEVWRRRFYAGASTVASVEAPPARAPWVCEACGFENRGRRREVEGCGPCTVRHDATMDCSRLGGPSR